MKFCHDKLESLGQP